MTQFDTLGLDKRLLTTLAKQGLTQPTPIQSGAIPHAMQGRDVMGLAQTGTGKTAAFGLPILHRLLNMGKPPAPMTVRALILAPTRELVNQIAENLELYAGTSPIRVQRIMGGSSLHAQATRLRRGTDILVATPGRLIDLLEREALTLEHTGYLVLDEADQMLDLGFIHALRKIARHLPVRRQTLLFSATMPKQMEELAQTYLRDPVRVEVSPPGKAADKIDQSVYFVNQGDKATLLKSQLDSHPGEMALVFSRTKHGAEKLMKHLDASGYAAGSIHGNKSQNHRERTLKAFRDGELKVLVATDVAARGIDIPGVRHVYNYDMPNVPENYVHRIGRTARAGADGRAVAFCAPAEISELRAIEKVMKIAIPVAGGEPPVGEPQKRAQGRPQGGDRRGGPGRNHGNSNGNGRPARRPSRRPKREQRATAGA
ncbi:MULTISPECIES: DEAD/DEAH box helicase [Haematobacter]|uniref:DEAD/DEAH box helicase n=1 Tax=Haematobacter genomosp. 1 TaxID=366618 RepID=A0A212A7A5_9RHOB|nr:MULTISPECIES: DEAD/DEAH box helicase [Haematobacter]OWJ75197.1 DEAD/DEAH box helicase [Haematobacter genomosp. 1]